MHPVKWALLCGGDFYYDGAARSKDGQLQAIRNLQGCVNDVHNVRDFLVENGVRPENIRMLTASCGDRGRVKEGYTGIPTWKNIRREMEYIREKSSPGDLFYFHYSGHGIRRSQFGPEVEAEVVDREDPLDGMALVMTDVLKGEAYLTGYHLGVWMQSMVENSGLRVTVVLDSCYSGSSFRHGDLHEPSSETQPRTIVNWVDTPWLQSDSDANGFLGDSQPHKESDVRDVKHTPRLWLSKPEGCTVLTACESREVAREKYFGGDSLPQGLLTHCILKHLRGFNTHQFPSHRHVIDHTRNEIRSSYAEGQQTPMIVGDAHHEFFGMNTYFDKPAAYVHDGDGTEITLGVGSAQGVRVGALYDVIPGNISLLPGQPQAVTQARVIKTLQFKSIAVLAEPCPDVRPGWLAVLRRWAFDPKVRIALEPEDGLDRVEFQKELQEYPGLLLVDDAGGQETADYTIKIEGEKISGIYTDNERLPRLPPISLKDSFAIRKLAYITSHVARFQSLQKFFLSRTRGANDYDFKVQPTEVIEGQTVDLSLSYHGSSSDGAWASVFVFKPSWGIEKLEPLGSSASKIMRYSIPNDFDEAQFFMTIPLSKNPDDPKHGKDLFAMFASNGDGPAVAWDDICLPCLPVGEFFSEDMFDIQRPTESNDRNVIRVVEQNREGWAVLTQEVVTWPKE